MWRVLHKLFGWDYVAIENSATGMICRIIHLPNGSFMFRPYKTQPNVFTGRLPVNGTMIPGWRTTPLTPTITEQ